MKYNKKEVYRIENTVVNELGEIVSSSSYSKHSIQTKENKFSMLYLCLIDKVGELSGTDIKLLLYLVCAGYSGENGFVFSMGLYEKISIDCSINIQSLYKSKNNLIKNKFLIKGGVNLFYINPLYFFSGGNSERSKFILKLHNKNIVL